VHGILRDEGGGYRKERLPQKLNSQEKGLFIVRPSFLNELKKG
jgi:hypothetical protein